MEIALLLCLSYRTDDKLKLILPKGFVDQGGLLLLMAP